MGNVMPNMTNITGYFDMSTVDVTNNRWVNAITGGNDITLSGVVIEDNAVKFANSAYGDYVCTEPDIIYLLVKKPTFDSDMCMIGKGKNGGTKTGFGIWHGTNSNAFGLSATGAPYVYATVPQNNYHVVVIARIADTDSYGTDSAMLFVDGVLYGFLTGLNKGNYTGSVTINRYYDGSKYGSYGENPMYVKAIAVGGVQNVEEIIENSNYLLNNVLPEKGESKMAGADAAAISWCIATTLQQAASLKNQILSYKKGIIDGDDDGTTDIVIDEDGSVPIEVPVDPDETDPTVIEKTAKRGADMWYTAGDDETGDIYYIRIYTLDTEGTGSSEMGNYRYRYADQLVYDLYNENGTRIKEEVQIRTYFNYAVPLNSWFITPEYIAPGGYTNYDITVYVKSVRIEGKTIIVDYRSINNTTGEITENSQGTNITGIPENVTIQRTTSEKPF